MDGQASGVLLIFICLGLATMPLWMLWLLNWLAGVFLDWEDRKKAKQDFLKRLSGD